MIKPCPFCQSDAELSSITLPLLADCADINVICHNCGASGPTVLFDNEYDNEETLKDLEQEAIDKWNNRS
jgi:Lar family restriction alleviation protein